MKKPKKHDSGLNRQVELLPDEDADLIGAPEGTQLQLMNTRNSENETKFGLVGYSATASGKGILKKANESILMTPVSGDFHFLSRKAFNVFLYHAQQQGLEQNDRFRIQSQVFKRDAGFDSNDMEILKNRVRNLARTTIEWGWAGEKSENAPTKLWEITTLLSSAGFEKDQKTGELWVYWSYSKELKEQLLASNEYTRLSLLMLSNFRTLPALVLYEYMTRYKNSPSRAGKTMPWEDWVGILKGKTIKAYPTLDYRRFNKETLKPALAQVNQLQDEALIYFKEFKTLQKITHLQLMVERRLPGSDGPDKEYRDQMDLNLFGRLISLGINQYTADTLYGSCTEYILRTALTQVEERIKNKALPEIKSRESYLKDRIQTLKDTTRKTLAPVKQTTVAKAAAAIPYKKGTKSVSQGDNTQAEPVSSPPSFESAVLRLRDDYKRIHATNAKLMYAEAEPAQRIEWQRQFEVEHIAKSNSTLQTSYAKKGLDSSIAAAAFYLWLSQVTWNPNPNEIELMKFGYAQGLIT